MKEKEGEALSVGVSETSKTIEADNKENGPVKEKEAVGEDCEGDKRRPIAEENGLVKEKDFTGLELRVTFVDAL